MEIVFRANDGTIFKTEEECRRYEYGSHMNIFGNIARVKRKRLVDENGIHYPIRYITIAENYTGHNGHRMTEFITLEVAWHKGLRLKGRNVKKGMLIHAEGCVKACAFEKKGKSYPMLYMRNASFEFLNKQERKY